jgi:[acyl-carrier-protein] S-malonyltransferase
VILKLSKKNSLQQLYNPVLWVKTINNMAKSGITQTIEVGPGKVLSGLNRRINKDN